MVKRFVLLERTQFHEIIIGVGFVEALGVLQEIKHITSLQPSINHQGNNTLTTEYLHLQPKKIKTITKYFQLHPKKIKTIKNTCTSNLRK